MVQCFHVIAQWVSFAHDNTTNESLAKSEMLLSQ